MIDQTELTAPDGTTEAPASAGASSALSIDPAFGHWLAGFADGEGCFYIGRIVSKHAKAEYVNFRPSFKVGLREDDAAVLHMIQRELGGMGRFETVKARGIGVHPMLYWTVERKAETEALVRVFDAFPLRAKKARDYAIWRRAVMARAFIPPKGGRWHGRHDYTELERLWCELKAIKTYTNGDAS